MVSEFIRGDILIGNKNKRDEAFHPIIFLGEHDDNYFLGTFLTHSKSYKKYTNIPLKKEHFEYFEKIDDRNIYFAPKMLFKKNEWGKFTKMGNLNIIGLFWVIRNIPNKDKPILFEEFIK